MAGNRFFVSEQKAHTKFLKLSWSKLLVPKLAERGIASVTRNKVHVFYAKMYGIYEEVYNYHRNSPRRSVVYEGHLRPVFFTFFFTLENDLEPPAISPDFGGSKKGKKKTGLK